MILPQRLPDPAEVGPPAPVLLEADRERVSAALEASRAPATRRAYTAAWERWQSWCDARGLRAMPAQPEAVAAFLAERHALGRSAATLGVDRAGIAAAHRASGLTDPTQHEGVRRTLAGLRRTSAPQRRVRGLSGEDLERALAALGPGELGRRDRALLLLLRDGMLRRSELAALTWADLAALPDGSGRLTIRRSKTDQEGHGASLYVTARTMAALEDWRPAAERRPDGAIFVALRGPRSGSALSGEAVALAVRRSAAAAGLEGLYGGHSLRRGTAEHLAQRGAQLPELMTAGRWRSASMPALYAADAEAGRGAVARILG